jgi:hypothetical protein
MRHLGSIVWSLLMGSAVYALSGIGLAKLSQHTTAGPDYVAASIGLAALLAAGLLYTPLVLARLSPLGPVLAGLAFLAVTGWATFAGSSFTGTVPAGALGVPGASRAPAGAVTALLAVPLLATIFSPRRWRRWPDRPAAVAASYATPPGAAPGYPAAPYPGASPEPAYPGYAAPPAYRPPASAQQPDPLETTRPIPGMGSSEATAPIPATPGPGTTTTGGPGTTTTGGPGATTAGATQVAPSAWPVRESPADPESTRRLP